MGQAHVRVWWLAKNRLAKQLGAGHGSVELVGRTRNGSSSAEYITWADGGNANRYSYANDVNTYGHEDWMHTIPLRDPNNALSCGLDGEAMQAWWNDIKTQNPSYRLVSKTNNCDGVTVGALLAGGAASYAPEPTKFLYYQGARTLMEWVSDVAASVNVWDSRLRQAKEVLQFPKLTKRNLRLRSQRGLDELPSVAEWKAMSYVRFGRRREQVAKIDQYLTDFWEAERTYTQGAFFVAYYKRMALLRILHQVYLHITLKPNSNRHNAVVDLGTVTLKAVHEQHRKWEESHYGGRVINPLLC